MSAKLYLSAAIFLIITLFASLFGFQANAENISIRVRPSSIVKGENIFLGDIASINAPAHLFNQLKNIFVIKAPKPDKERNINREWIVSRIGSILPTEELDLNIPEDIKVVRASQTIEESYLLSKFKDYLQKNSPGNEVELIVTRFNVKGNHSIPLGQVNVELERQSNSNLVGYITLTAIVRVNNKFINRIIISAWIDRFENVVCTKRRLPRNTILTKNDIYIDKRNISRLSKTTINSLEYVLGKRLKRPTEANAIILTNMIDKPPLIKRGDKVTIIAQSQTLIVKTEGIALSDGFYGEQIPVQNIMSKKNLTAIVVNSSTVKVSF